MKREVMLVVIAITVLARGTTAEAQSCGQVLQASTTLAADLLDCPGDGLVIGAAGIVVDLGRHTIIGKGQGVGIRNHGFNGVTIKNGTVKTFDYGVQLYGVNGNTIEQLTVTLNQDVGIELSGSLNNVVSGNAISEQPEVGVALINGSTGNTVANNLIYKSQGRSLVLVNSGNNTIQNNIVSEGSDEGVVFTASCNNRFWSNSLSKIGDAGRQRLRHLSRVFQRKHSPLQ